MTTDDRTLPDDARLGRAALSVADLQAVTAFYRDVVGLDVLARDDGSATLGAGGEPLLVLNAEPEAPERPPSAAGLYHTAFRVPSRAALGDALSRIRADWHLDGASDHGVSEALYLTDPEDNGVEIYRDYPRETWPVAGDGTVLMWTESLDLDAVAAAAAGRPDAPADTDVGHVHLEVTSLADFGAFYVDALGFTLQTSAPGAEFVAAGGYHHHVGANTWRGRTTPAGERGLSWFEVELPGRDGLEALRERLAACDVSIHPIDEPHASEEPHAPGEPHPTDEPHAPGEPHPTDEPHAPDEPHPTDEPHAPDEPHPTDEPHATDEHIGSGGEPSTDAAHETAEGFEVSDPDGVRIRFRTDS